MIASRGCAAPGRRRSTTPPAVLRTRTQGPHAAVLAGQAIASAALGSRAGWPRRRRRAHIGRTVLPGVPAHFAAEPVGTRSWPGIATGRSPRSGSSYARCRKCGTVFMIAPPADLGRYYTGDYYQFDPDGEPRWKREAAVIEYSAYRMAMLRGHAPAGHLIEIGAGTGAFASAAQAAGFDVSAIEMDERCCEYLSMSGIRAICSDDPAEALVLASCGPCGGPVACARASREPGGGSRADRGQARAWRSAGGCGVPRIPGRFSFAC